MVGEEGIEPSQYCYHWILSPTRLPIPPLARAKIIAQNPPSRNSFPQSSTAYVIIRIMDSNTGGLSSAERQRQTAAEIARKKVLASYASGTYQQEIQVSDPSQKTVTNEEWEKYHSAWQNYYQKYYSDYYANAAKQYVATSKFKEERARTENGEIVSAPESSDDTDSVQALLRATIRKNAQKSAKNAKRRRRLIPIFAGLSAVLVVLFLQYNRLIFAPIIAYVSPGNSSVEGITAIDPTVNQPVSADPKLLIPKLNIDVPVHFNISPDAVMRAMNNGVAHYAISGANALPGQIGNLVITGHSAGDVYSNNQYKYIFSGLERLENGDLIYVNYESKRYTYSVTKQEVVDPSNVAALIYTTDKPVLTLVTCTPLGTSKYRLLVTAEQIDPSYEGSSTQAPAVKIDEDQSLPANEPSFFEKIWLWLTGRS